MGRTENPSIWEKIQRNVQETERLIGQKKYNLAMIKARQTMEYMVKLHCDKAGIVESTPDTMIRELYGGKWISKSTAEHYLQILSIGEQAAKDGDNGAFNANQAYHLLSQEVYAFSNSDKPERTRRSAREASVSRGSDSGRAASSRAAAGSRTSSSRAVPQSRSRRRQRNGLNSLDLLKLLIPIVLIIVLIFLIRILAPKDTPTEETSTAPVTTEAPTTMAPTEPETTEDETAAPVVYRTTDVLNVRSGPSTNDERIGKLDAGASIEVIGDYDETWAIIIYNGQEAYVSKDYLTLEEPAE